MKPEKSYIKFEMNEFRCLKHRGLTWIRQLRCFRWKSRKFSLWSWITLRQHSLLNKLEINHLGEDIYIFCYTSKEWIFPAFSCPGECQNPTWKPRSLYVFFFSIRTWIVNLIKSFKRCDSIKNSSIVDHFIYNNK